MRVALHAPHAELARRVSPLAARLEPLGDGRTLLEAGGRELRSLGLYVALLDCDFEVLDPPELADELRVVSRRLPRAARSRATRRAKSRARRGVRRRTQLISVSSG